MAEFLDTSGVTHYLVKLIKGAERRIILVSPYLQLSERVKEYLHSVDTKRVDVTIIHRGENLSPDDSRWLDHHKAIKTGICKNLHAKCYLNEQGAIVTSMNLYQFSQENNNEMGIYISREKDGNAYNTCLTEVERLSKIGVPLNIVESAFNRFRPKEKVNEKKDAMGYPYRVVKMGYCIRTGIQIPFNIEMPMCEKAFKSWAKFANTNFEENYCHYSGEHSNGETTFDKPVLKKYWKKAVEL